MSNWFVVSSPDGFDPLRYEYLAREGLPPDLLVSDSYRIVLLLQFIYQFFPHYLGYIIFATSLLYLGLRLSREPLLRMALFSPISLYFFAQTGKDWISILAFACFAAYVARARRLPFLVFSLICVAIALSVRPTITPIFPVLFVLIRYGVAPAAIVAVISTTLGLSYLDSNEYWEQHESTVQQEDSGELIRKIRAYTFGYAWEPILLRFILYIFSPIYQPALAFAKGLISGTGSVYILYEGVCIMAFLYAVMQRMPISRFILWTLPFNIVFALASPFYHFRYIEILYPIIFVCAFNSACRSTIRREKLESQQPPATRRSRACERLSSSSPSVRAGLIREGAAGL